MLQIVLAALHLLALPLGLAAVIARGLALGQVARRSPGGDGPLQRAFAADGRWGAAAAVWIGTGVWRYLADVEKSTAYYNRNHLFLAKMGFLAIVLVLEAWPMVTLVRWRAVARRSPADVVASPAAAGRIAAISWVQAALVVAMVFLAAGMARGFGARPGG
jgi:putative membrane protein